MRVRANLILAGAPLGNPGDASGRLSEALATADLIAAEDTRKVRRLAADLGISISGTVVSFFEGNEEQRLGSLLTAAREGRSVLVVTDAGMPAISDPGYRLVRAAIDDDIPFAVLPGPSAVLTALVASGLPTDRFSFEGFLPRKSGERRRVLRALVAEERTMVFFEAPHRITDSLADCAEVFGADRSAAVCRELTKHYEEIKRGPLGELARWAADGVRGEITVVIGGAAPASGEPDVGVLAAAVADMESAGLDNKSAIRAIAHLYRAPRRAVYDAVLAYRGDSSAGPE